MPAVMEQVDGMSVADKMRLMEYLVKSISSTVMQYDDVAKMHARDDRKKPCISDFIGYGARFHKLRTTEEWMKELREGEEE
ncbi:MAG: hypothetical protein IKA69_00850 [Kiritimatiellae bacterium]|nr:hypothetical protein [Kiritimatiellia bacterium]